MKEIQININPDYLIIDVSGDVLVYENDENAYKDMSEFLIDLIPLLLGEENK